MKPSLSAIIRYLPLGLGLAILAVAIPLVPWQQTWPYLLRLSPATLALLVAGSWGYYFGRILRYWLTLRMLGEPLQFRKVALACLVAQPVTVLPAGELYRGAMLKRYGNVALQDGMPSVFAQSVAESMGLLILALVGAMSLHRYEAVIWVLAGVFTAIWAWIRWHNPGNTTHRVLNMVPGAQVPRSRLRTFLQKDRLLLSGRNFWVLLVSSYISTFSGIAILLIATRALDVSLNPLEVMIAYTLPAILEAVSFLPGGLGINEQGSVGILLLFGVPLPLAVALTIIVRVFTLGIGFVYGFAAMAWAWLGHWPEYD